MSIPTTEQQPSVERLLAEGVPLHRIEEMLDDLEQAAACSAQPKSGGFLGRLVRSLST
jgi:hypothetical protein